MDWSRRVNTNKQYLCAVWVTQRSQWWPCIVSVGWIHEENNISSLRKQTNKYPNKQKYKHGVNKEENGMWLKIGSLRWKARSFRWCPAYWPVNPLWRNPIILSCNFGTYTNSDKNVNGSINIAFIDVVIVKQLWDHYVTIRLTFKAQLSCIADGMRWVAVTSLNYLWAVTATKTNKQNYPNVTYFGVHSTHFWRRKSSTQVGTCP